MRRCGEAYRLERVWRVPQVPTWAQVGGSAVHAWTEAWDIAQYGGPPPHSFDWYLEAEAVETAKRFEVNPADFRATGRATKATPNNENRDWWAANGPAMCNRWITWRERTPLDIWITPEGEPAIEWEFKLELGKTLVVGFIDRVMVTPQGHLVVLDIKSGSRKISSDGQLGIYKVALKERYPEAHIPSGAFWYAREGMTGEAVWLNEWSVERATWEYEQADSRRKRGDFQPNPGDNCGWCSVRDYCIYAGGAKAGEVKPPWVADEDWYEEEAA